MKKKLNIENQNLIQTNFKKILNKDQIKALNMQSVWKWSDNTIKKALRLKLSYGSSGYQELLAQGIPLPNERTLRRRLENVDFKPGIWTNFWYIEITDIRIYRWSRKGLHACPRWNEHNAWWTNWLKYDVPYWPVDSPW